MEDKHTALVVLGIIVILAIIGLLLMIKTEKTGEAFGGIYTNYKGEPFPYTRQINKVMENPASYGVQTEQEIPDMGGASRTFGGDLNPGAEIGVSKGFVYPRDPQRKIYQVKTSCTGQVNIGVLPAGYTRGATVQHAQSLGIENCIKAPEQISNYAYCCKEPSAISGY